MDESMLLDGVLRSVLGGRRKRSRRAMRYLERTDRRSFGSIGGSLLSNPNVLLTAAGVAWGIFETLQQGGAPKRVDPGFGGVERRGRNGSAAALAGMSATSAAAGQRSALQIVRLAISAAYADGCGERPGAARDSGAGPERGRGPHRGAGAGAAAPLAEIVAGVTDDTHRATLYVLAFGIVRGDEQPSGAERIYLAKLAHLLGLDPKTVQQLEQNAAQRIDAQPEQ